MGDFVRFVRISRFCWINGFYGAGKTTLSLYLADMMIQQQHCRYVALNLPLEIDTPVYVTEDSREVTNLRDVVLVLDEAGQFLDWGGDQKSVKKWFSFLRKRNQIVLMPSVIPPVKYASQFTVQRIFNGLAMGLPMWLYRWKLRVHDIRHQGLYYWWSPNQVFGLFDTDYEPDDRWYIYDFGNEVIERDDDDGGEVEQVAESDGVRSYAVTGWPGGGGGR